MEFIPLDVLIVEDRDSDARLVLTSSPGLRRLSPSLGEVRAVMATRLALEPELTSRAERKPKTLANSDSNWRA